MSINMTINDTAPATNCTPDVHAVEHVTELLRQALLLERNGELEQAAGKAEEAVALAGKQLGETSLYTGYALIDLALIQEKKGEKIRARDNLVAALHIVEPILSSHHHQVSQIFMHLHELFL